MLDQRAGSFEARFADRDFFRFVREERVFCSILAHLLLQSRSNLSSFLGLINERTGQGASDSVGGAEQAQIYIEFSWLRDFWNTIERDNDRKRDLIRGSLKKIGILSSIEERVQLPIEISAFNSFFMGPRGIRITSDIVYPGQWSMEALNQPDLEPETFRELCKFKWAFNIKPDMVILVPGVQPFCIEAKLESREGVYPSATREQQIFDQRFGPQQGRVRQFELQRFMFEVLLGAPCQQLVIGRPPDEVAVRKAAETALLASTAESPKTEAPPFITWREVFDRLDISQSLSCVKRLVLENEFLGVQAQPKGPARPEIPVDEP